MHDYTQVIYFLYITYIYILYVQPKTSDVTLRHVFNVGIEEGVILSGDNTKELLILK